MRTYEPLDGTWRLGDDANNLRKIQADYREGWLTEQLASIKLLLCDYFSSGKCDSKQGKTISPMGATKNGGKILKVRWTVPGQGKSGGLRLCIVVFCEEMEVIAAEGWLRKTNASDQAYFDAAEDA